MHRTVLFGLICLVLFPLNVAALESDRNQSVLVEADEVEMDFGSGKRIYRGNVSIRQGTIRILADQIELFYEGEQLHHAVAQGNPAVFRQRPDGKNHDIVGTSRTIELDEIHNIVTFITEAQLRQDRDAIEGERIVYDMARDRMTVRGGTTTPTRTTRAGEDAQTTLSQSDAGRPRLVIQPDDARAPDKDSTTATIASEPKDEAPEGTVQAYVGDKGAPTFAGQSVTTASLGTLVAGTPVRVLRAVDGWAQVNTPRGVRVWIYGKFVSSRAGLGTVTGSGVRLRSTPSTGADSRVIGEASSGQKVWVVSVHNDWKQIEAPSNLKVWIPASRIQKSTDAQRWKDDWRSLARTGNPG